MLSNLTPLSDWHVVTNRKQWQDDIDNSRKNTRYVRYYYSVGDIVYVEKICIYRKLDYKNNVTYRITEVFKNGTVQVQRGAIND